VNHYSIKDLEQLSGIKAHTIRIWEQRYGIILPQRTDTNIRYYSDEDLKRILNIALLNNSGYKISRIAKMKDEELRREVLQLTESTPAIASQLNALIICMVELDEQRFEKILSANILKFGFEKAMVTIIFPFLERVGAMWMTGSINPAHEHFMSNLVRQKIIVAIDGQSLTNTGDECYMLFCPEGEFHEIGLLFMNYLLRARQKRVVYLGASVPFSDLPVIYGVHSPQFLFTYATVTPTGKSAQEYSNTLSEAFPKATIFLAGRQFTKATLVLPDNVNLLRTLREVYQHLDGDTNI
jgi:DNA-binding transcriptional MerR regulator